MSDASKPTPDPIRRETPLEGWKEIGAYLQRTGRTVRRWEKREALPVYRQVHETRTSVYAFPNELDAWREKRAPETASALIRRRLPWRPLPAFASTIALALMLLMAGSGPQIGTMNAQGAEGPGLTIRRVWAASNVGAIGSLSADGRYLAFTDWEARGNLAVRDLISGENRRLTDHSSSGDWGGFAWFPVISPDGRQVAYTRYDPTDSTYDLHVTTLEEPEPRILAAAEKVEFPRAVGWSPDGERILVAWYSMALPAQHSDRGFEFISAADGSRQVIESPSLYRGPGTNIGSFRPANLSPDGRYIVYDQAASEGADQRDIFLLSTDGSQQLRLIEHPADDRDPVWTPDGKRLLFASDRTGAMGFWSIDVADGELQGTPELVKADIGRLGDTVGFTDNGSLYYSLDASGEDVFIAELDPEKGELLGQPTCVTELYLGSNMGPVWSPDGTYLAYHSQRGARVTDPGSAVIVIRSVESGDEREIRTTLAQAAPVRWFPDGQSLLVTAGRGVHYRVDVRSGESSLIHQAKKGNWYDHPPDLSPDGRTIYFVRTEHDGSDRSRVFLVMAYEIQSQRETEIHRFDAGQNLERTIRVSPDGKQLAFIVNWSSVQIMASTGGQSRELLRVADPKYELGRRAISWSPDGQYLFVVKNSLSPSRESELVRIPMEGGEPQSLGIISMEGIRLGGVHPDGRRIVFRSGAQRGHRSELWVMENFLPEPPPSEEGGAATNPNFPPKPAPPESGAVTRLNLDQFVADVDRNEDGCMSHEEWSGLGLPEAGFHILVSLVQEDCLTKQGMLDLTPTDGLDINGDGILTVAEVKEYGQKMSAGGRGQ